MQQEYILSYQRDDETDQLGFFIESPENDMHDYSMAVNGRLVAHQIIEHTSLAQQNDIGTELQVLGAIWFVRGQFSDMDNIINIHRFIANDIERLFKEYKFNRADFGIAIPALRTCYCRDELANTVELAKLRTDDPENTYFSAALAFIVQGFLDAHERYAELGGAVASNQLFHLVADNVDIALYHANTEGERWRLIVDTIEGTVNISQVID